MCKSMKPYLIGKFIDEDIYTIHILKGNCYHLLAEFSAEQKESVIEKIKNDYPVIADKLKNKDLSTWGINHV